MTWYLSLYLTVISMLSIASSIEERKLGFGWFHILLSLISILIVVVAVLAHTNDEIALLFGKWLLPFVIASVCWGLYGGMLNLKKMKTLKDLTKSENTAVLKLSIIISILVLLPGYTIGFIIGLRLW